MKWLVGAIIGKLQGRNNIIKREFVLNFLFWYEQEDLLDALLYHHDESVFVFLL